MKKIVEKKCRLSRNLSILPNHFGRLVNIFADLCITIFSFNQSSSVSLHIQYASCQDGGSVTNWLGQQNATQTRPKAVRHGISHLFSAATDDRK